MLLSNSLFCIFLGSLLYVSEGQSTEASEENLEVAANALLGSLFGSSNVQTCLGENCNSEKSQPDQWEEISSVHYVTDYEETKPGYVETSEPSVQVEIVHDEYRKFCRDLTAVIKEVEYINPEFKTVKHEVLEKFGRYSIEFASQLKKCYTGPAAIQLLDLIILVAEKIKSEYASVDVPYPEPEQQTEYEPIEEIVAEEEVGGLSPGFVGSVRGIPGEHFPNYTEVPITSFSCADKYIPGFYADLETGCQVFHVCYEHRRESFLCPVGTIFNQPILACDYWYSSNCSLAPVYYDVNKQTEEVSKPNEMESTIGALITTIIEGEDAVVPEVSMDVSTDVKYEQHDIAEIVKFLPVKAEVVEYPEPIPQKPVHIDTVIESIPEPKIVKTVVVEPKTLVKTLSIPAKKVAKVAAIKASVPFIAKAKLAAAAVPVVKVMKAVPVVAAMKAAVPLVKAAAVKEVATKAKIAATVPFVKAAAIKSAAPVVVKAKFAAAAIPTAKVAAKAAAAPLVAKAKVAVVAPAVKAKVAVPVAKMVASSALKAKAVPIGKAKVAALPVLKAKFLKTAAAPLVKGKMVALPLAKAKFAGASVPFVKAAGLPLVKAAAVKSIPVVKGKVVKAAMLSPLTKKALALGYMKLLKAKKLGMMG